MGLLGWIGFGGSGETSTQSDRMTPVLGDESWRPATQTDLLKAKVHKELASQYLTDLADKISRKCFDKCYVANKASIDTEEGACTAMCSDRYLDTFNEVRKTLQSRNRR